MPSIYKYLPSRFVTNVLDNGQLLFRNLTYFRQCEGPVRGDAFEGIHVDNPDNEVTVHNSSTGRTTIGKYRFLNSTDSDHIFGFCFSCKLDTQLMADFKADACIEFFDVPELTRRVKVAMGRMVYLHKIGLLAHQVHYYKPNEPAPFDITDPKNLAFVKTPLYCDQSEFRFVFGSKKGFKLIRQIVQPQYDPYEEALTKKPASRPVILGSLHDIARLVLPR